MLNNLKPMARSLGILLVVCIVLVILLVIVFLDYRLDQHSEATQEVMQRLLIQAEARFEEHFQQVISITSDVMLDGSAGVQQGNGDYLPTTCVYGITSAAFGTNRSYKEALADYNDVLTGWGYTKRERQPYTEVKTDFFSTNLWLTITEWTDFAANEGLPSGYSTYYTIRMEYREPDACGFRVDQLVEDSE